MSTSAHPVASGLSTPASCTQQRSQRRGSGPRQSTPDQARGLQLLSNAIGYLVDSRLFDMWQSPSDATAVQILMACSREVFQECDVLSTWPKEVRQRPVRRLQIEPLQR